MFDNVCKFLAETFSTDFASWLLGESITLTELSPSELSLEPIRADALILLKIDSGAIENAFPGSTWERVRVLIKLLTPNS